MGTFAAWIRACDRLVAYATEGMMTDDFPMYDWRSCYEWGDTPEAAVLGVLTRLAA
jgi:hypothetical protein